MFSVSVDRTPRLHGGPVRPPWWLPHTPPPLARLRSQQRTTGDLRVAVRMTRADSLDGPIRIPPSRTEVRPETRRTLLLPWQT